MTLALARPELHAAWVDVCAVDDLEDQRGACVLVEGTQVALFRVRALRGLRLAPDQLPGAASSSDEIFAIDNNDPFSGAAVLSRGIVGSRGEELKVSSPVFKQSFNLRTGQCLDDPDIAVATYGVRIRDGRVQVAVP